MQGKFWPNCKPVSTLGNPMHILSLLLCMLKLLQLEKQRRGNRNEKTYVKGLTCFFEGTTSYALNKLGFLFCPKINKCLCIVLLKRYESERRERLHAQRGEACNSIGVLTRVAGSRAICVFLCDFTGVFSWPTSSGATPKMKTYTLKILNSWAKLPFLDSKHWLNLSWNFYYVRLSWQRANHVCPWGRWGNLSNPHNDSILPEIPRPYASNEPKQRSWSSTNVLPSVVVTTMRSKILAYTNFRGSLEEFHLMTTHTQVTLWFCVSLYICLSCSLHSSFSMLMSKSCLWPCYGYVQSIRFVCACYVCYERISHTHTQSHIHCRASIFSTNERLIMSIMLVTSTVNQSCWTYVFGWFGSFHRRVVWVCVFIIRYAYFHYSHT